MAGIIFHSEKPAAADGDGGQPTLLAASPSKPRHDNSTAAPAQWQEVVRLLDTIDFNHEDLLNKNRTYLSKGKIRSITLGVQPWHWPIRYSYFEEQFPALRRVKELLVDLFEASTGERFDAENGLHSIQLNKDLKCKKHRDPFNWRTSWIVGMGNYKAGRSWEGSLKEWHEDGAGKVEKVETHDIHYKFVKFSGANSHETQPWSGDGNRYTATFFSGGPDGVWPHKKKEAIKAAAERKAQEEDELCRQGDAKRARERDRAAVTRTAKRAKQDEAAAAEAAASRARHDRLWKGQEKWPPATPVKPKKRRTGETPIRYKNERIANFMRRKPHPPPSPSNK